MTFILEGHSLKTKGFFNQHKGHLASRYLHYLHIMKSGAWKWLSAVIQIL